MSGRDLLEIFDAALPRLVTYAPGSVPKAGDKEYSEHQEAVQERRVQLGVFSAMAGSFGLMAWLLWTPWMPLWILVPVTVIAGTSGAAAARRFLQLAFGRRLEQALPSGTDAVTAQLEDGTWSLIRYWNADAFVWNQAVAALRLEVVEWRRLETVPEARGIEWTPHGSRTRAEGLIAAMRGLISDREALVARRDEIEHSLRRLDARMHRLKASEEVPVLALPAPDDGPEEDD